MSVVICDDDRVTRSAIGVVCTDLGLDVVAETDQWTASLELARRFEVDLLVLDITLVDGSGEQVLEGLRDVTGAPRVVVFSAYLQDVTRLKRLGATEVVEKPDFTRLALVLAELMATVPVQAEPTKRAAVSRRVGTRPSTALPVVWRSPSGIAPHRDLAKSLDHVVQGDTVLVATLTNVDDWADSVGARLLTDCHLAVGRLLASTIRVQDIVHDEPASGGFIALLRGGDDSTGSSVLQRLQSLMDVAAIPGVLASSHAVVGASGAQHALREVVALQRS